MQETFNKMFYAVAEKAVDVDTYKTLANKVQDMSEKLKSRNKEEAELAQEIQKLEKESTSEPSRTKRKYTKRNPRNISSPNESFSDNNISTELQSINANTVRTYGGIEYNTEVLKDYESAIEEYSNNTSQSIGYNFEQLQDFMENDGLTVAEIGDDAVNNLVSRMRGTVFSVEMVNSYDDIVEPLLIGSKILHDEHMSLIRRLQWENTAYAIQMLETLRNIRQADQEVGSSLFLQMRQFMRQPVWYTLGQAAISLLKFTGSTLWSVLFGRDKTVTVQEKILKATREQTEFLRTGQIEQQRGFFTRLLDQGIAGMPLRKLGRTLLSGIGIDKDTAQQREDQKSLGQTAQGGIMGKLSDLMYRGEITKKGRTAGITGGGEIQEVKLVETSDNLILDVVDNRLLELVGISYANSNKSLEYSKAQTVIGNNTVSELKKAQRVDKKMIDIIEDVEKNTKLSAREQRRLRRQLFAQNMVKIISGVVGNILQMGNMIVNAIKLLGVALAGKLLGGKMGGMLGGALGKGGLKGIGGLLAKGAKFLGPIGILGAAGYSAYSGMGDANDHFGLEGELDATIGQKLSSALGGIAESFTFGLMDSGKVARAIHGFGEDVKDKIGGMFTAARDYINSDDTLTEKLFMNPLKGLISSIKSIPALFTTIGKEMINSLPIVGGMQRFRNWFNGQEEEAVDYHAIANAPTPVPQANTLPQNNHHQQDEGGWFNKAKSWFASEESPSDSEMVKTVLELPNLEQEMRDINTQKNIEALDNLNGEIKEGNGQLLGALNKLIEVVTKSSEPSNSNQFPIGHDDLTYQNVYGAN